MENKWTKLTELPEQKVVHSCYDIVFWEIREGVIVHQGRPNKKADVESFEVLDGHEFIARDHQNIYHAWTIQKSIDRDTFAPVEDGYYKDKDFIYYEYETSLRQLKGQTTEGFEFLDYGYARDKNMAYHFGSPIRKCTVPLTLELIEQDDEVLNAFVKDQDQVFYQAASLKGSDPLTWKWIKGSAFSRDANFVYFCSDKLGKAKSENWKQLGHQYSVSGKHLYYMGWRLMDVDFESFEVMEDGNGHDRFSGFLCHRRADYSEEHKCYIQRPRK